jgi:AraC family transcriptional activator of pobA
MESNIPKYDLPVDYIVGEGFAKDLLKSYKNFPCKIESGLFILCIKGTMEVTINTNTHHISENDLITLPPNCILEVHTFSSDIQIYYAGFSSHFIESINLMKATQHLLPLIMENPVVRLSNTATLSYKMFYESSIYAYQSLQTRANREIVKAVLTMFIQGATEVYKMRTHWDSPSYTREYEVYQEFMQLVIKNYTFHHGTSFYAKELGLSLPHLCYTIKKATGNTPLKVIASIILMDAKSRLKSTNEPVKNIALSLGFNNISFFNKFFKKHTGMTPQDYRIF